MSNVNTKSLEYYAAILFVQAVAEDGKLSQEEAKGVEDALGGFLEGAGSEIPAIDFLNHIADEMTENIESYVESLKEAIIFFGEQNDEVRAGILDLMKDLAGTDGVSFIESKFFDKLKSAWNL
ncbi:MAG: hypothetical protein IPQ05_03615 [Leptospiraceae bacterium]|nr:hypothetical protein [Leptospiraceae bacterium]MBL0262967.1 hypothetical protein [Leptospiraceae bacterium]